MSFKTHKINIIEIHQPGIYAIHNKRNDKYYIGSTNDLCNRTKKHRQSLYNGYVNNKILPDLFTGEKQNDFEFIALEVFENGTITETYLRKRELYFIKKYSSDLNGYNNASHPPVSHPTKGENLVFGHPEAQKKATARYEKENYDKVLTRFPKGTKDKILATGAKSVNSFIIQAVNEKLDEELPKQQIEEKQNIKPL